MYGYVVPQKSCMSACDFTLYRAYYCGICKATGALYGQLPRFTANYDMTFFSILLHELLQSEAQIRPSVCVLNPFKKKDTVCRSRLMDMLAAVNILLSYYKAADGVEDKQGIKYRAVRRMLTRPRKAAAEAYPQIDAVIKARYNQLAACERAGTARLDEAADCFSLMLKEIAREVLGGSANDNALGLCYNVGKFVYLADALDDIDEDYKKGRYNPFLASLPSYQNRRQFIEENRRAIEFALACAVNRATECFNNLESGNGVLKNIIHHGLRQKMHQLIESEGKLPPPKI